MNNLNIKKIALSLAVASLFSGTAFANTDTSETVIKKVQDSLPTFSELVKQYDADKSETLNAQELTEHVNLAEIFAVIDVNKDSEINSDEYNQYVESLKAQA